MEVDAGAERGRQIYLNAEKQWKRTIPVDGIRTKDAYTLADKSFHDIFRTFNDSDVTDVAAEVNPESSTSTSIISRQQIAQAPGGDNANSLAMITNYVPSAYLVHDQLHIRGGHQVSWLLDGVPVPNTNIASNVGPQFDPKDIDYLEVQRGGYSAEYGDRTYGVFNVVTRSGFERNREAVSAGDGDDIVDPADQLRRRIRIGPA